MRRFSASLLVLLSFAAPAAAQQPAQADTGIADFERNARPQVGSRGVFVGLVAVSADSVTDPVRLWVDVPPQGPDSLCVDLISRDGYYEGRFRFTRAHGGGRRMLVLPTRFPAVLRRYGTRRLAPVVHVSPTCSRHREVVLPAGWSAVASPSRLRALLNPGDVVEARIGVPASTATCMKIRETDTVAYDYECAADNTGAGGYVTLTILTRTFGGPLPAVNVPLWVPDARR